MTPAFFARYRLLMFLVIAFGLFWLATPLSGISFVLVGLVASYAPSLSALTIVGLTEGSSGVRQLFRRVTIWRVGWVWYLVAIGIPLFVSALINLISGRLGSPGRVEWNLLAIFPILLIFAAGEELGWRGFALPNLLARYSVLPVALGLGVVHALYHLPLWIVSGSANPSYTFPSFLMTSLAFGIIWTWLFQNTRGSVLISTLFHGMVNLAANLFFGGIASNILSWLMPAGFISVAVIVLIALGPELSRSPRLETQKL